MKRAIVLSLILLTSLTSLASAVPPEQLESRVNWGQLKQMWTDDKAQPEPDFIQPGITEMEAQQAVQSALAGFNQVSAVPAVMATKNHGNFLVVTTDEQGNATAHLVNSDGALFGRALVDRATLPLGDPGSNYGKIGRAWYGVFCGLVGLVAKAQFKLDAASTLLVVGVCNTMPETFDNYVQAMSEQDNPPWGWERQMP